MSLLFRHRVTALDLERSSVERNKTPPIILLGGLLSHVTHGAANSTAKVAGSLSYGLSKSSLTEVSVCACVCACGISIFCFCLVFCLIVMYIFFCEFC